MALVEVEIPQSEEPVPEEVRAFLREAEDRIQWFLGQGPHRPTPAFIPSDHEMVYRALRALTEKGLAAGRVFCEWGCGFGVVAGLAAGLGYRAYGIEIEAGLLEQGRRLADDRCPEVRLACGSFVPQGGEDVADRVTEFGWFRIDGPDAHAELALDPAEVDVVFAYPWPGEEEVIHELFDRYAGAGALLLTYHGIDGVRLQRKLPA